MIRPEARSGAKIVLVVLNYLNKIVLAILNYLQMANNNTTAAVLHLSDVKVLYI